MIFQPPSNPLFQYIPIPLGRWKRLGARFHAILRPLK